MKFDRAIEYIAESTLDLEMAKPKNMAIIARAAELEKKGLSKSTAYAYANKEFKAGKLGNKPAETEPSEPVSSIEKPAGKFKRSAEALRAKEQVADFIKYNKNATAEDVAAALDLDPELVASVYDDAQQEVGATDTDSDVNEPNSEELKADLDAKLKRVRDQIMRLRGLKGKGKGKPGKSAKDIEEPLSTDDELEPELDPDIQNIVRHTGGSVDQEKY